MENYQQKERKICFMDCVWNIFFKWRILIITVVFFAVLFGMLKYMKDSKEKVEREKAESNVVTEISEEDIQNQLKNLSDIDKAKAETAMNYVKSLYGKKKYAKNAAIMKLDSYNVNRVELCYSIESEKNMSKLVSAYSNVFQKSDVKSLLVAESEGTMQNDDVSEMIIVRNGGESFQTYNANKYVVSANDTNGYTISANNESTFLYITARGNNEEQAQKFADRIKLVMEENFVEIEKLYGKHSLTLIQESCMSGRDSGITALQDEVYKSIYEMSRDIVDSAGKMSKEAAQVVDNYEVVLDKGLSEDNASENIETENKEVIKVSVSKKWVFFGAIFGALIIGGIEVLLWLLGGKLNSPDELQQNFDIHLYGVVEERKKHKILGVIDELIYRFKNRNKKILNEKQNFQMILSGICLDAKRRGISSIYVTGTEIESIGEKAIINELKKELAAEEVNLIIGKNILCDSEALLEMSQTRYVILAEETGCSKYQEIIREMNTCQNQSVDILGSIVFAH
ncbi:hypothetical protein C818_02911 [Lachnospiraceae bacterium MD308]|nr:hypothetical protein C818_02911 [Lachnospiraceae bacterium MD308]MCI8504095.1 hypothetical protein [Dorea sp.]